VATKTGRGPRGRLTVAALYERRNRSAVIDRRYSGPPSRGVAGAGQGAIVVLRRAVARQVPP